jgi:hypothetical protein
MQELCGIWRGLRALDQRLFANISSIKDEGFFNFQKEIEIWPFFPD